MQVEQTLGNLEEANGNTYSGIKLYRVVGTNNDVLLTIGQFGVQPSVHNMAVPLACVSFYPKTDRSDHTLGNCL